VVQDRFEIFKELGCVYSNSISISTSLFSPLFSAIHLEAMLFSQIKDYAK